MVRKKRQRKQLSCFDKSRWLTGSAYRTDLETSVVMFWEICETLSPLLEVVDNLEAEDREMRDSMRERTNMGNLNLRESFGLGIHTVTVNNETKTGRFLISNIHPSDQAYSGHLGWTW